MLNNEAIVNWTFVYFLHCQLIMDIERDKNFEERHDSDLSESIISEFRTKQVVGLKQ